MIPVIATGRLLDVARKASSRGQEDEDFTLVAILFSAFGAEAWLNDLLYRIRTSPPEECVGNLARLRPLIKAVRLEERTTSTITKYDVIGTCLSDDRWDRGIQTFQDFDLVLDIRNFIAHQRPETMQVDVYVADDGHVVLDQPELTDIGEQLVKRKILARPARPAITPGLALVQKPEVGVWAFAASCRFVAAMAKLLPRGGWRDGALVGLEDMVTPYI